jgi:hypothetical protein
VYVSAPEAHEIAAIVVENDVVTVRLLRFERLLALHGDITVPRWAVQQVDIVDAPLKALKGWRAPGTGVPLLIAYGTWRHSGVKDFAAVRRGQRAVRLTLERQEFAELMIGITDPESVVRELTERRSGERSS